MKSISQIRAANALRSSRDKELGLGQKGGDALSGFPTLIRTAGLLSAGAFAIELNSKGRPKQDGARLIMDAIAQHLSSPGVDICDANNSRDLIKELASADDDSQLRRATAEAIAFLNYLKRFVV
jgi:CRISPR/Cas system CMR-associated protein Cmr5 small subunit